MKLSTCQTISATTSMASDRIGKYGFDLHDMTLSA